MRQMINVVFYLDSLGHGGAERVSIIISEYLQSRGTNCSILTARKAEKEYCLPDSVKRYCLFDSGIPGKTRIIQGIRKFIKQHNIDVIITMGVPDCLFTIPASMGLKTKNIVSERNDPNNFKVRGVRELSRFFMRFADGYVFQTTDAKKFYKRITKGKGEVIPNPIFNMNIPDHYFSDVAKTIVSVGRLDKQKNQQLLIEAFCRVFLKHNDYRLVIYGEGNERSDLEKIISEKGVKDYVSLPGVKDDILNHIKSAEIFVLSSDYEGMPNALIEAMTVGLPCVSTDCPCGGPRDLIDNGINGVLVPVNDIEAMAQAIDDFIEDKEFAKKCGENAKRIRMQLCIELIGKKWEKYVFKIADRKG